MGLKKTSGYVSVLYVDFVYDARVYKAEPYDAYELSRGCLVSPLFLPLPQGALSKEEFKILTSIPDSLDSTYSASFLTSLGPGLKLEGPSRLSYELTKLSINGSGNPLVSRTLAGGEREGKS